MKTENSKKILVCIDCQNDFITGSLAVPGAEDAMKRLANYIESHSQEYETIVITKDWHPENHSSFQKNGGIWPEHCVANSKGSEIYPELKSALDNVIFTTRIVEILKGENPDKEEYSAFETPIDDLFKQKDIQVDICGIAGDFCVKESVKDILKHYPDIYLNILPDFIASLDGGQTIDKLSRSLETMHMAYDAGDIVKDLADTDFYTLTVMYCVMMNFPRAEVEYDFFDRNKETFPDGFDLALRLQLYRFSNKTFSKKCADYLRKNANYLPEWYIVFMENFKPDFSTLDIYLDQDNHLHIKVKGKWWSGIIWEMPILSCVSELMHMYRGEFAYYDPNKEKEYAKEKILKCMQNNLQVSDMGTRRRFSAQHQDLVVRTMVETYNDFKDIYSGKFIGTSNILLAEKYNTKVIGTQSHQLASFIEACVVNIWQSGHYLSEKWNETFVGNLGIALIDCFTSKVFLNSMSLMDAKLWSGFRVDSGDEFKVYDMIIERLKQLKINPEEKSVVFSNSLNINKAIEIQKYVDSQEQHMKPSFGIGTFFTCDLASKVPNDAGEMTKIKPMNIVLKATKGRITEQREWHDLVKLSDDDGKGVGNQRKIEYLREQIKNVEN